MLSNGPQQSMMLGAALFSGPRLLSVGCNIWGKTTPRNMHREYNGNVHAEVACLVRRQHYANANLTLYVARLTTNVHRNTYARGCSRPCDLCMDFIRSVGVKKVRFYDDRGLPTEIRL